MPHNLEDWLKIATEGLCNEAKARVRGEIEAHFEDARAAGMDAGLTAEAAEREALAGLGDPKKSRKYFRKTYLRNDELELIERLRKAYRRPRRIAFWLILGLVAYYYLITMTHLNPLLMIFFFYSLSWSRQMRSLQAWFIFTPGLKEPEQNLKRVSGVINALVMILLVIPQIIAHASKLTELWIAFAFLFLYWLLIMDDRNRSLALIRKLRDQQSLMDTPNQDPPCAQA